MLLLKCQGAVDFLWSSMSTSGSGNKAIWDSETKVGASSTQCTHASYSPSSSYSLSHSTSRSLSNSAHPSHFSA